MNDKKVGKESVKYFFMISALVSASYFWLVIFNLVGTTNSESWTLPIITFSVMFIFWALAIILESSKKRALIFGAAIILLGIIFTQTFLFGVTSVLAIGILYLGTTWIHESMDARIKLSIWMSLRLGRRLFVAAISLVVVGGFLMPVLLSGEERVLPVINIGEGHMKLIGRVMAAVDSNFNFEELSTMTVNEYIIKEQERFLKNDTGETRELTMSEEQVILSAGRVDISRLAARNIEGEEKIMNIFIEIINNKINNYFNTEISQSSDFAPLLFSLLSFFAIFSIGSFATAFLTFLVALIFKLLLLTNLVSIGKKNVEVEVIN